MWELMHNVTTDHMAHSKPAKHDPQQIRKRMIQVRQKKDLAAPKERFNEQHKEETASIRSALAVNRLAQAHNLDFCDG